MNTLLIFFALPIATIILAAVLETILRSPVAVAAVFFAIYLIVTFAAFDVNFLIATIIYTILAFLTAVLVRFIQNWREDEEEEDNDDNSNSNCNEHNLNATNLGIQNGNWSCGCRRR